MINVRNILIGSVVSAVLVGIVVSCGGGSGSSGPTGPATYTVSGALSGATGTVVLKLNGGSDVSMANGPFTFTTMLASGATFNVQVVDASDRCTVTGGAGTMTAANVTGVAVACAAQGIQEVIRSARLDGAQAGTTATGTGLGGVIVNPTTRAITGGITFSGLTGNPTAAHIHRGDTTIAVGLTLASDNATGIVLDLRSNVGGYPETVAYLAGRFLGDKAVQLSEVTYRDHHRQWWTPDLPIGTAVPAEMPVRMRTGRGSMPASTQTVFMSGSSLGPRGPPSRDPPPCRRGRSAAEAAGSALGAAGAPEAAALADAAARDSSAGGRNRSAAFGTRMTSFFSANTNVTFAVMPGFNLRSGFSTSITAS